MKTRLTLSPGQKGTKKLLQQYGDQLVCIRYRYNPELKRKYKTVELIVEESPWIPDNSKSIMKKESKFNKPVKVRIGYSETNLRDQIKNSGGRWQNEDKAWLLPYRKAVEFGLESRIVG
jgi:hypothetical protein